MKFFVKLLLLIAVILAVFFLYINTKPNTFDVSHTKLIKAPISTVYKTVNNYKTWDNWAPWIEQDTTLVVKLFDKTQGVDAGYTWESKKDAGGSMKTLAAIENKSIQQEIIFNNSGSSDIYWKFNKVNDGTEVTWGIKGDLGLLEKAAFSVAGGPELMFKPMIIDGLNNLDELIQKNKKSDKYSFIDSGVGEYGGQYYVGLKAECSFENLGATLDKILPDVLIYCMQNGIKKEGSLFNLYHKYDEKNKRVEVSSCVPVKEKVKADSKYDVEILEKGKYHKTIFQGNYSHSDEAWENAIAFINKKGLIMDNTRKPFEVYVKGHTQSTNPEDWITEIYLPVK
jgi:effector-binding domain-containing protein/ribosome-associated toxin RatA of RatAB toxin-antitoxin module